MTLPLRLAACLLMAVCNLAHGEEWNFDVYLDSRKIGEHAFTLHDGQTRRELESHAEFQVKVLFVEAYRYSHLAREQWHGDCLSSLDARTVENGETTIVRGALQTGGFVVNSPKDIPTLPACIMTFAYWNPVMLTQKRLLNPQTGEWLDVDIRLLGRESMRIGGQEMPADHYRLEAPKLKIDLWYSPAKAWLGLQSTTPEGYVIRYKLRQEKP